MVIEGERDGTNGEGKKEGQEDRKEGRTYGMKEGRKERTHLECGREDVERR